MNFRKCLTATIFLVCIGCFFNIKVYASTNTQRISGSDRYKTSVEISKSVWEDGSSKAAILTTGEDYPDALSAAPLAKKLDAPILLTNKNKLTSETETELNRLGVNTVYIIGGTGVVSMDVENRLKSMNIAVTRLGGVDRYETSVKIAEQLDNPKQLAVTTGDNFSDALSIAPFAALKNMPILLVPKNYVPNSVKRYLSTVNIDRTYIIGGTDIISNTVSASFNNVSRIGGADKYARNISVIKAFSSNIYWHTIYIATGNDFPDALSGSVIASKESAPIVLVGAAPTTETKNFINQNKDLVTEYKILGGDGVVSPTTLDLLLPAESTIDKGTIEGSTYTNNQLGFTMSWPESWSLGFTNLVSDDNGQTLLGILKYPVDKMKDNNYGLICVAQGISGYPSIKTGKDYLSVVLNGLEARDYIVNKNIYSLTLGGKAFDVIDVKANFTNGNGLNMRIYSTVIKNIALTFIMAYQDSDGLNDLNNSVMNTIRFTN